MENKKVLFWSVIISICICASIVICIFWNDITYSIGSIFENKDEKELIEICKLIDNNLRNNEESNEFKNLIKSIHEIRKVDEKIENKVYQEYIFDVDLVDDSGEIARKKIIIDFNGNITLMTILESEYTLLGDDDYSKKIYQGINSLIEEDWEKAKCYQNVSYKKIYKKI